MIKSSTTYALTDLENIVILKGSKKNLETIKKRLAKTTETTGLKIWNAPSSNIGDKLR